jgi:galactokinase
MGTSAATYFCPGRINLIGEHIDYNGGQVMPAAISLGITATLRPNGSGIIHVKSDHAPDAVRIPADAPVARPGHWSDHVIGVLLELQRSGITLRGCDVTLSSTLPQGSGLSSSAAIEVLTFHMFTHWLTGTEPDRRAMALACQRVENTHIGVNCGIMDQYAVAMGREGHALLLDCATLHCREIPVETGRHALVIIDSRAPRTLAASAYNQRRAECEEALALIRHQRDVPHLTGASQEDIAFIPDPLLRKRARHVVTEQQRVVRAAEALQSGDLSHFGQLLNASHASLRDDYTVSSPQLDHIVAMAQAHGGCLGARLTGAGFGGCCIALMDRTAIEGFRESLRDSYRDAFGLEAMVHECRIVDGVGMVGSSS